MTTTKVFQNGNSQAVRIPSEMRTDKSEFIIRQVGDAYIIYPVDDPWSPLRQVIGNFSDDFMSERNQPNWSEVNEKETI